MFISLRRCTPDYTNSYMKIKEKAKTLKDLRGSRDLPEKVIQEGILAFLWGIGSPAYAVPNRGLYDKRTGRYNVTDWTFVGGVPDIVAPLTGGRVVFLEVKSAKGKTTPAQDMYHERLQHLGHYVAVVRSVKDVEAYLKSRGLL